MKFFGIKDSLRTRIIVFCSALLVVVQVIAFYVVNNRTLEIDEQRAKQELVAGNSVFQRLLSYQTEQLINASVVLTADFGFRRAVAMSDAATIRSALENHGRRIGADVVMLVGLDNQVIADTREQPPGDLPAPLQGVLAEAKRNGQATAYITMHEQVWQTAVVPVFAPDLVSWVVLGFGVGQTFVDELRGLTNLHVSFLGRQSEGMILHASSLPEAERQVLLQRFSDSQSLVPAFDGPSRVQERYYTQAVALDAADASGAVVLLQRSTSDIFQHLNQLRRLLIVLAVSSIVISIIGIIWIANTVTRPLSTLAKVAERIKLGDYSGAANYAERGEIGLLAESFNLMRDSIPTLLRLAYRDPLTNLPNRSMFNDRMDQAIKLADRRQESFTLLFIDLDRFKEVNDTYGHEAGDIVLKEVSHTLEEAVRETDTVARLGGDEFAIILLSADSKIVERLTDTIQTQIETQQIPVGDSWVSIGCSIGSASYPSQGRTARELMHSADVEMYSLKQGDASVSA